MEPVRTTARPTPLPKRASPRHHDDVHAKLSAAIGSPQHTYVEQIHTPRRSGPTHIGSDDEIDWEAERHAHVDAEVSTPHGLVPRDATPISTHSGSHSRMEDDDDDDDDDVATQKKRTLMSTFGGPRGIAGMLFAGTALTIVAMTWARRKQR